MTSAADRVNSRLAASVAICVDAVELVCQNTSLADVRGLYARARALSEANEPGQPCTATRLMMHLGLDANDRYSTADKDAALATLRNVADPAGGWDPALPGVPATNTAAARGTMNTFLLLVQKRIEIESIMLAAASADTGAPGTSASSTTPGLGTGGSLGASLSAGSGGGTITFASSEDKKTIRLAECGAWLEKHDPKLGHIAPSLSPHKECIFAFDPFLSASSTPPLPQWSDVRKKLHRQDTLKGRESGVADLVCALIGMLHAYAGPMPDNFVKSSVDTTLITYDKKGEDSMTRAPTLVSTTRPPCLSAASVNRAIADIYATGEPLDVEQKEAYAAAYWSLLSQCMGEQSKQSLTRALCATIEHRNLEDWRSKTRRSAEAPAVPHSAGTDRFRGRSSDRRYDGGRHNEDRDRDYSREHSPRKSGKGDGKKPQKPHCASWAKDGTCALFGKGRCKDHRHNMDWANIGKEAYEDRKK